MKIIATAVKDCRYPWAPTEYRKLYRLIFNSKKSMKKARKRMSKKGYIFEIEEIEP